MTLPAERLYYENPALWTPSVYNGEQAERAQITIEHIPADTQSVLDAGCGNGVLTNQLQRFRIVIGIDRSFAALRWVQKPRCQTNLATLPFADNSFDAVISTEVLEHLPVTIYEHVLDELARVARHSILITVPYCENLQLGKVICPYCGCCFHRNYHMRSFTFLDMRNLFGDRLSIEFRRASGIGEIREPGALRVKAVWRSFKRRLGLFESKFGENLICPQCEYTKPLRAEPPRYSVTEKTTRRLRLGHYINRFVPEKVTPHWWLAVYIKTQE